MTDIYNGHCATIRCAYVDDKPHKNLVIKTGLGSETLSIADNDANGLSPQSVSLADIDNARKWFKKKAVLSVLLDVTLETVYYHTRDPGPTVVDVDF